MRREVREMDLLFRKDDIRLSAKAISVPMIVGKRIKTRIIEKESKSIKYLERTSGVPRRTIYNALEGADVKVSTLYRLCKSQGITLSEFFEGFEEEIEDKGE